MGMYGGSMREPIGLHCWLDAPPRRLLDPQQLYECGGASGSSPMGSSVGSGGGASPSGTFSASGTAGAAAAAGLVRVVVAEGGPIYAATLRDMDDAICIHY